MDVYKVVNLATVGSAETHIYRTLHELSFDQSLYERV